MTLLEGTTSTPHQFVVGATSGTVEGRRRRVPLTMPRAQAYYWRYKWQDGERAALVELDAGEVVRFDSDDPEDIVRWLHEDDEE